MKKESESIADKLKELKSSRNKRNVWHKFLWALVPLALIVGAYFLFFFDGEQKYEFTRVTKIDLKETVEITGNVEADATIALSFRASGKVEKINYETGERVEKDAVIAELSNTDQALALDRAKASLQGQRANLNERLAGSTVERIKIAEAQVGQAEATLEQIRIEWDNAKEELELIKQKYEADEAQAQLKVDDAEDRLEFAKSDLDNAGDVDEQALENAMIDLEGQIFSTSASLQQSLVTLESILDDDGTSVLDSDYYRFDPLNRRSMLLEWYRINNEFNPFYDSLQIEVDYEMEKLKEFYTTLSGWLPETLALQKDVSDGLANMSDSSTLSQATIDQINTEVTTDSNALSASSAALNLKYQTLLAVEVGNVSSGSVSENALTSAQNFYDQQAQALEQMKLDHKIDLQRREAAIEGLSAQFDVQKAAVKAAEATLADVKAKPRAVDIAFLQAQVAASEIDVALREEDFDKTLLKAPTDGIVSRQNIEIGEDIETALQREIVFEMISDDKFKIEADIAEVDIGKIEIGDQAEIILDPLGDDSPLTGTIMKIDPVETLIQDVVFYKAEIVINEDDERIKPGMTANVEILLNSSPGALTLPDKAIQIDETGRQYVRVLEGEEIAEIDVETGIRNIQGDVEILSGVTEGQEIILRILNNGSN